MNEELKRALEELYTMKRRFELELSDWGALSESIGDWLETGHQLSQAATKAADSMTATMQRWSEIREALIARLDADRDDADWWKSS